MTGPVPPGQGGLPGRLAELERRIQQLTQRRAQVPTCVVRLGANVGVGAAADVRPTAAWKSVAEADTAGIYHYNESGDTWWQMPNAGRFRIMVQSLWGPYGTFNPSLPPIVATSILLNSGPTGTPATYGIAQATAYNPDRDTAYSLVCEDRVFATNDRIRINFWSQFGGTLLRQQLQTFTHVVIRYLGPD